ncbi:MAG: aldehyde:ferredoxin oxidoreductase, partial [Deltaproteobacteria bacterium]|nr:aldehyde:ferredoxin oxidoreductase [Deltaproteobacteria bacterium]
MYGHNGKILKFAAKLVYDTVPADADPLGPDNAMVFAVGPMTDTPIWGTSRGHMAAISPQTGFFADSNYGGDFGMAQKRTGFGAILVTGASSKPVYLLVTEEGGQIKDAASLWGKTTEETNETLQSKTGKGSIAASIGPAGEKGVIFANI